MLRNFGLRFSQEPRAKGQRLLAYFFVSLVPSNADFAKGAPVLVFDGVESFSQITIDFDLHLLGETAEFCKCFGVEGPESAQVG